MTIYQLTADNEKIKVNNPYEIGVLKLLFTILDENKEGKIFIKKSSFDIINEVLKTLTLREEKVIRLRFGINDKEDPFNCVNTKKSYEKIAEEFGLIDKRIKQIETKALHKLRHPSRLRKLGIDDISYIYIKQSGKFFGIKKKIYDEIVTTLTNIKDCKELNSEATVYLNLIKPYFDKLNIKCIIDVFGKKIIFTVNTVKTVFQYDDFNCSDIANSIFDEIMIYLRDSIINTKLSEGNIDILLRKGYLTIKECILNQEKIIKEYIDFGLTDYANEFLKIFNNRDEIVCFASISDKKSEQGIYLTEKERERIKYNWCLFVPKACDLEEFNSIRANDIMEEIRKNKFSSISQLQSYLLICKAYNILLPSIDDLMSAVPNLSDAERNELSYWCGKNNIIFIRKSVVLENDCVLFDDIGIESLELSVRAYNCLCRAGYNCFSDLKDLTYEDLMRIRNLGSKSAKEVLNVIHNYPCRKLFKRPQIKGKLALYTNIEDNLYVFEETDDEESIKKTTERTPKVENDIEFDFGDYLFDEDDLNLDFEEE